jgi:precorrin-2 dehydrogenase / sirohydrochlorin ferrochelatase
MIPIALDAGRLPIGLAGRGPAALRRLLALQAGGARDLRVYSDGSDAELRRVAGPALRDFLPRAAELAALRALWIVGLSDDEAAALARLASSAGVLVNVEDRPALCDFHSVAQVRRGELLLTVSTTGASPGLAARIRARLAAEYGPDWAGRLALLRDRRATWRRDGADVAVLTDVLLQANGWLA